jgi:hypothetical protein
MQKYCKFGLKYTTNLRISIRCKNESVFNNLVMVKPMLCSHSEIKYSPDFFSICELILEVGNSHLFVWSN